MALIGIRYWSKSLLFMLLLLSFFHTNGADKPNIVLIIGDDMSPDFGCYGKPVRTPNIDCLSENGIRFTNAYVSASSCSPSRCSIITGRYPHNTGAPELHMVLPEGQFMFPEALKQAGYYCIQAGKWHMGDYANQAFNHVYEFEDAPDPGREGRWVRCLEERPKDKPFFMWFAAFDAHRPWEPDPEGFPHSPDSVVLPAGVPDTPICRQDVASYYDEIQRFDRYVGMVVSELKNQNVLDNTLIIILGDNGRPFPRNKTTLYDNGLKTPLIIHWPEGIIKGGVSEALVGSIDLAPTILESAGIKIPDQVQGVSLLPVINNSKQNVRDYWFGERNWHVQRYLQRMVRWDDFIYIRNYAPNLYSFQMGDWDKGSYAELLRLKNEGNLTPEQAEEFSVDMPEEMLFKVSTDYEQVNNLADKNDYLEILKKLRKVMIDWQNQTGDSMPAIDDMTPDRHDRKTFERLYPALRPPTGIIPGENAGAIKVNTKGPIID